MIEFLNLFLDFVWQYQNMYYDKNRGNPRWHIIMINDFIEKNKDVLIPNEEEQKSAITEYLRKIAFVDRKDIIKLDYLNGVKFVLDFIHREDHTYSEEYINNLPKHE